MKRAVLLLVLLLPALARAEEEKKDPLADLPGCLRRGAAAKYERAPGRGRLKTTVEYRIADGELPDAVVLVLTERTADLGPLTLAERIHAMFDAVTRRFVSFTYEVAKGEDSEFLLVTTLHVDPDDEKRLRLTRYRYDRDGERHESTSRLRPPQGLWTPDRLEPFAAALLAPKEDEVAEIDVMDIETGRISRSPPAYRSLGEGEMKVGEEQVRCRILRRKRGSLDDLVYRRVSDGMPVKDEAARLTMSPPENAGEGKKEDGR